MASDRQNPPSISHLAFRRQISAVRAACGKAARADPSGGRRVTGVPTATQNRGLFVSRYFPDLALIQCGVQVQNAIRLPSLAVMNQDTPPWRLTRQSN